MFLVSWNSPESQNEGTSPRVSTWLLLHVCISFSLGYLLNVLVVCTKCEVLGFFVRACMLACVIVCVGVRVCIRVAITWTSIAVFLVRYLCEKPVNSDYATYYLHLLSYRSLACRSWVTWNCQTTPWWNWRRRLALAEISVGFSAT